MSVDNPTHEPIGIGDTVDVYYKQGLRYQNMIVLAFGDAWELSNGVEHIVLNMGYSELEKVVLKFRKDKLKGEGYAQSK